MPPSSASGASRSTPLPRPCAVSKSKIASMASRAGARDAPRAGAVPGDPEPGRPGAAGLGFQLTANGIVALDRPDVPGERQHVAPIAVGMKQRLERRAILLRQRIFEPRQPILDDRSERRRRGQRALSFGPRPCRGFCQFSLSPPRQFFPYFPLSCHGRPRRSAGRLAPGVSDQIACGRLTMASTRTRTWTAGRHRMASIARHSHRSRRPCRPRSTTAPCRASSPSSGGTARSRRSTPSASATSRPKAPMQRDTLFRIASMTKPVTSVAALMLIEEGKLKLEDPVTKWLPELAGHAGAEGRHRAGRRHLPGATRDHGRGPDDPPRRPRLRLHLRRARSPTPTRTSWARRSSTRWRPTPG